MKTPGSSATRTPAKSAYDEVLQRRPVGRLREQAGLVLGEHAAGGAEPDHQLVVRHLGHVA
jgi:hypothetical protein